MGLIDGNGLSAADLAAVVGNNNSDIGGCGGVWWILILLVFAAMFGNGVGFGGNGGAGAADAYMQRGFDQQSVMGGLNGIQASVSNGFANAEVSRCNQQTNILQAINQSQAANAANMNALAMSLQSCCCENRASVADLKYTVAQENCSDRQAISDGIRDVIANQNDKAQMILDKLCQQEIDALKAQNANLQTQLNMANLAASQTAQTAKLLADNAAQTNAIEQYLAPPVRPAYIVQNPNGCGTPIYTGCGCGSVA